MSDKSFSEINEGWLELCQEYKDARYNRDILLFPAFNKQQVNMEALDLLEDAETILESIEKKMNEYRDNYDFNLSK